MRIVVPTSHPQGRALEELFLQSSKEHTAKIGLARCITVRYRYK
jgi:hypothetical protein